MKSDKVCYVSPFKPFCAFVGKMQGPLKLILTCVDGRSDLMTQSNCMITAKRGHLLGVICMIYVHFLILRS